MDYPKVKVCLDTSEDNLIDELYTPCLKWAERFDRGVGYFTTGWLTYNVAGLSDFASRGGQMRLITSTILSTEDTDAIIGAENQDGSAFLRLEAALLENVEILKQEMEADIINTFSWMLYDGIIDMRFAIPCEKLEEGDFHDKFGIFCKGNDALSFSGSINDSKHGFQNYESIKVFKTWAGTQEYVDADTARFEKIWNRKDRNLKMFTIPQAVKNKIFELRSPDRPYSLPAGSSKWVHQDIAVKTFLEKEHGILAMATGTGKTVTAMKIINKLFDSGEIRRVVITMYGNDLLDQWAIQIRENYKNKQINYHYASQKMMKDFVMHPDDSILILSRDARNLSKLLDLFDRLPGDYRNDTLFVFDEVQAAPAGNDIPFDDALCEQGRNFNNKIWNAFRLIKGWTVDSTIEQPEAAATAVKWFKMQLDKTIAEMDDLFGKYRLSEAMMAVYKLFWDEFSSWYLEMVKPGYQQPVDKSTYLSTLGFFDALLRLLHPFMPFITEELWQALEPRKEGESLMVALIPEVAPVDNLYLEDFEIAKEIVGGVRTIRLQKNIPNKEALELQVLGEHNDHFNAVIAKMCNLSSIIRTEEKTAGSASFLVRTTEYAVPLGNMINVEEELAKLQDELKYQQGFLASVMKKLSNESFVSKAPAKVIEMERKKQADAESKIKSIEESIAALKK